MSRVLNFRNSWASLPSLVTWLGLLALILIQTACDKSPARPKHAPTIKILPDAPPPPPPPKPEEKKPDPQKEDKPQQQINQPKSPDVPQPQALKSDEAAGDGPGNGMQAGSVTQDYKEGIIGTGDGNGGFSRLAMNSFANSVTKSLNDFLSKDREVKRLDYKVKVNVWLEPDGRLQRAELAGSTGDDATDAALRASLNRYPGIRTNLPEKLPQPLRLMVSNRTIG